MRGGRRDSQNLKVATACFRSPDNVHPEKVGDHQDVMNYSARVLQSIVRSHSSDQGWLEQGQWCWEVPAM